MQTPSLTEGLLELLDRNGWSTAAFRRQLDIADWPLELRSHLSLESLYPAESGRGLRDNRPDVSTPPAGRSLSGPPARINDVVAREAAVAYGKIRRFVRHTPLEESVWLSRMPGSDGSDGGESGAAQQTCKAMLKFESEQHTGSFKVRGALSKLLSLQPAALARGVFTASTGNHALAVLYACAQLSTTARDGAPAAVAPAAGAGAGAVPAATAASEAASADSHGGPEEAAGAAYASPKARPTLRPKLYVPSTASPYKVRKLRALGAELHLVGIDCLQSELAARAAADAAGAVYVSPYNDPWVMAGQGTLALELLAERRRGGLDAVLVPVGGGGLIGGVASVLKAADPAIRVIGCQPAASDVMARSVAAGAVVPELDGGDDAVGGHGTLSDATAGGVEYDSVTLQPCTDCVDEWVTVDESEIAEALVGLLEEQSKLVEGAAACALAAFKRLAPKLAGRSVVVVCCGGNIALPTLRRAIEMARPAAS